MHWHLDVAFREDRSGTLEKWAAQNLNVIQNRFMRMPCCAMPCCAGRGMKRDVRENRLVFYPAPC